MERRSFLYGALAAAHATATADALTPEPAAIPLVEFGKSGVRVQPIAQGGARMDLHPDVATAAAHVRRMYELGVRFFDCARSYWGGRAEEAYGIGLEGVRRNVFLTSKTMARTAAEARRDLETSLRLLKTDYLDLWQIHDVRDQNDIGRILAPGGALEALEAAKKEGKCRLIGFTGHFDPAAHAALLKAYGGWDSVMMPLHAADHAWLSFEQIALPVAVQQGVAVQAIKVFGKANLLRALNPVECLRYVLSLPGVHVAICGAGTEGQMLDNIRTVQNLRRMTPEELAGVRQRATRGLGVATGPALEYWKKPA
ncbi:MAG: aldo/keto reductase [Bryobacteraceae bacterium]|nr:aldo/keto reductase [Bryobacteraceae bacterium]MCX7604185.1 aldo/keto reductase [Bryobacteraceae bacterium]